MFYELPHFLLSPCWIYENLCSFFEAGQACSEDVSTAQDHSVCFGEEEAASDNEEEVSSAAALKEFDAAWSSVDDANACAGKEDKEENPASTPVKESACAHIVSDDVIVVKGEMSPSTPPIQEIVAC